MEESSQTLTTRQLVQLRKSRGLCDKCGFPPAPGMARCAECGIAHRKAERKRKGCTPYVKIGVGRKPMYEGEEV